MPTATATFLPADAISKHGFLCIPWSHMHRCLSNNRTNPTFPYLRTKRGQPSTCNHSLQSKLSFHGLPLPYPQHNRLRAYSLLRRTPLHRQCYIAPFGIVQVAQIPGITSCGIYNITTYTAERLKKGLRLFFGLYPVIQVHERQHRMLQVLQVVLF